MQIVSEIILELKSCSGGKSVCSLRMLQKKFTGPSLLWFLSDCCPRVAAPAALRRCAPKLPSLSLGIIPWQNSLALPQLPQSQSVFKFHFIKEPSLFAVAKLLETGLVNMRRIEILWRPLTGHLLEVTNGFYHLC